MRTIRNGTFLFESLGISHIFGNVTIIYGMTQKTLRKILEDMFKKQAILMLLVIEPTQQTPQRVQQVERLRGRQPPPHESRTTAAAQRSELDRPRVRLKQ